MPEQKISAYYLQTTFLKKHKKIKENCLQTHRANDSIVFIINQFSNK